jgi:hypothetical protein
MSDEHIKVTKFVGQGKPVRTGVSPQCSRGEHQDCPGIKNEVAQLPMVCVCEFCHLLSSEVI